MRPAAGMMIFLALAALLGRAEVTQPLPTPFPAGRYAQMSAKSPFAVATAAAPVAAPTPGFAAALYVTGVARVGASEFVTIKTRGDDKGVTFVEVGKTTPEGIHADRVEWSNDVGRSKVYVSKNGEKATLSFDQDEMAKVSAPPANPVPPGARMPLRPIQFPGQPGPMPGLRPRFNPGGITYAPPGQNIDPRMQFRRRNMIPAAPGLPGGQ